MSGETRTRTYGWTAPDFGAAPLAERSGLEFFGALASGALPPQPITATIGWTVEAVEPGFLRLAFLAQEHLFHAGGLVHGGVLATLLDSAMSGAVMASLAKGRGCTTLQLGVSNLRGVGPDTGALFAEGRATHVGRQTGAATGVIVDAAGRLYAQGTTSLLLFDL